MCLARPYGSLWMGRALPPQAAAPDLHGNTALDLHTNGAPRPLRPRTRARICLLPSHTWALYSVYRCARSVPAIVPTPWATDLVIQNNFGHNSPLSMVTRLTNLGLVGIVDREWT
ncbi:hypothetical protein NL676_003154 [Syzygium grande]|nr:hypothetical protein NL676_003154 [Syzygium grande]